MSNRKQSTDLADILGDTLENKDLSATLEPTEDDEEEPAPPPVEVEMIHHYTHDGVNLLPGETHTLPAHVARPLIAGHFAKAL